MNIGAGNKFSQVAWDEKEISAVNWIIVLEFFTCNLLILVLSKGLCLTSLTIHWKTKYYAKGGFKCDSTRY